MRPATSRLGPSGTTRPWRARVSKPAHYSVLSNFVGPANATRHDHDMQPAHKQSNWTIKTLY